MNPPANHLNELSTSWSLLEVAHDPAVAEEQRTRARQELVTRYEAVVKRYLAGALRRQKQRDEATDELLHQFVVRVMEGKLHTVSAERGEFRPFLRTTLRNLVRDYLAKKRPRVVPLSQEPAIEDVPVSDEEYLVLWREELVRRALKALEEHERQSGQVLHSALKLALEEPQPSAAEVARRLSEQLAKSVDADWVRGRLFQARRKLRELLRREVGKTLQDSNDESAIDEELAAVGLLQYCR